MKARIAAKSARALGVQRMTLTTGTVSSPRTYNPQHLALIPGIRLERHPQRRAAPEAREAGRDPGTGTACVVHPGADRAVGHPALATVRLRRYRMRGYYTIQTRDDNEAWLAEEAALLRDRRL